MMLTWYRAQDDSLSLVFKSTESKCAHDNAQSAACEQSQKQARVTHCIRINVHCCDLFKAERKKHTEKQHPQQNNKKQPGRFVSTDIYKTGSEKT